jgi:peptide/nickel transport system permease protein
MTQAGPSLLQQAVRRTGQAVLTLLLVLVVVFVLTHLAPGDPLAGSADTESFHRLPPEREREIRELYHLDQPFHRQCLLWFNDLAHGDLGRSFHDRVPVRDKIMQRLPITFGLNLFALVFMVVLAVPLGALAAWRPGTALDRWAGASTYGLYAIPVFWAGLLLQILFAVRLGWLPLYGIAAPDAQQYSWWLRMADRAAHLVLPVTCLGYGGLAYLSRFVRANLLEGAQAEVKRAARARGMSEWSVVVRHGFRQAAVPMLTLAGFIFPTLVGGSVIVEEIFAIPGLGRLFVNAVFQRDIPVIMGLTLLSGTATLAGILLADLGYLILDPRVRRG